jgi:hypothetical protein
MKVRIKKTGEILEVAEYAKVAMEVCDSYGNPLEYGLDEIEIIGERRIFESHSVVDWQQVKIQAAIGAMQALISKESGGYVAGYTTLDLAERAVVYANSLVVVLREKDVNV